MRRRCRGGIGGIETKPASVTTGRFILAAGSRGTAARVELSARSDARQLSIEVDAKLVRAFAERFLKSGGDLRFIGTPVDAGVLAAIDQGGLASAWFYEGHLQYDDGGLGSADAIDVHL